MEKIVMTPNFVTDCFFEQGRTHEVCEDYAVCDPLKPFVALSDGCSNGGGPRIDSDWGARFLCKAAEQHQVELYQNQLSWFCELVLSTAEKQQQSFPNLNSDCLTATLLAIRPNQHLLTKEPCLTAFMVGDGVYGGLKHNGEWTITAFEYQPGGTTGLAAPYYLRYMLGTDLSDHQRYFELFGGKVKMTTYVGKLGLGGAERQVTESEQILTFNGMAAEPDIPIFWCDFSLDEYEGVFIGSDGLSSFEKLIKTETTKHTEPVPLLDVLEVLLDIPVYRPGFLRLQRQWAFKRAVRGTFQQRSWHNNDDVSMGMIYVE